MVERLLRCLGWVSLRLRGEMALMLLSAIKRLVQGLDYSIISEYCHLMHDYHVNG